MRNAAASCRARKALIRRNPDFFRESNNLESGTPNGVHAVGGKVAATPSLPGLGYGLFPSDFPDYRWEFPVFIIRINT